jgi:hypothetical protein
MKASSEIRSLYKNVTIEPESLWLYFFKNWNSQVVGAGGRNEPSLVCTYE